MLKSGILPRFSVLKRHATSSVLKLDALIWSSGAYLVEPRSPPQVCHPPLFAPCCAETVRPAATSTAAAAARRSLPRATKDMVTSRKQGKKESSSDREQALRTGTLSDLAYGHA